MSYSGSRMTARIMTNSDVAATVSNNLNKKFNVLFYSWKYIIDSHVLRNVNYDSRTKCVNKMLSGKVYSKLLIERHRGLSVIKKMGYAY